MKNIIFIAIVLFSVIANSQTEESPKVELDSLQSKAFRFEFMECELIKKELNSTEKLLLKEEKTASAYEKIIDIQEKEQMQMIEVIEKERALKERAYEQAENLKKIIKKKDSKNFWENLGIAAASALAGFGIGSASK